MAGHQRLGFVSGEAWFLCFPDGAHVVPPQGEAQGQKKKPVLLPLTLL